MSDSTILGKVDDSLIERVRKLLDKAAATANEFEADAFSRKAAELAVRYRIDPDRLAATTADELGVRDIVLGRGAYVRARLNLLMAVADAHDAKVLFIATPTGTVAHVAGFRRDLDLIEVLYHSLHTQASVLMAQERRSTAAATQRFRRSFLFGFADRVAVQLNETRSRVEAEATGMSASSTELALLERGRQVDEYVTRTFGRVRSARPAAGAQVRGWSAGSEAGAKADIGRVRVAGRRALGPG